MGPDRPFLGAVACAVALWATPAATCQPPLTVVHGPDFADCVTLSVQVPGLGDTVPPTLAERVLVSVDPLDDRGDHAPNDDHTFPDPSTLRVERLGPDGPNPVEFTLADFDKTDGPSRWLRLDEPAPGRYRVHWDDNTCMGIVSDASPLAVGEFGISEEAPFPSSIGEVTMTWTIEPRDVDVYDASGCVPESVAHTYIGVATVRIDIAEEMAPWLSAGRIRAIFDDEAELWEPLPPEEVDDNVYEWQRLSLCSTDRPGLTDRRFPGPTRGTHEIRHEWQVEGFPTVSTPVSTFVADCGEYGANPDDGSDEGFEQFLPSGGCSAQHPKGSLPFGGLALVALLALNRRRRG